MRKKLTLLLVLLFSCLYLPLVANAASDSGWYHDSNGWWYLDEYGEYPQNCIRYIHGEKYLFDERGYMMTGWNNFNGTTYYFNDSGAMANSGWQEIDNSYYYFNDSGNYEKDCTVEGYFVDVSGKWDSTPGWKYSYDRNVWYYVDTNGKIVSGSWKYIDGKYYYFYEFDGVMATGYSIDGYFVNDSGAWENEPGWKYSKYGDEKTWYYVKDNGYVACDEWLLIDGNYYYFENSGYMVVSKVIDDYYVNEAGIYDVSPGWKYDEDLEYWYYVDKNGKPAFDEWKYIDGKKYHFNDWNGAMDKSIVVDSVYLNASGTIDNNPGWKHEMDIWFYVKSNGKAAYNEWVEINGKDYYFYDYGGMAYSCDIDGYFLSKSGACDKTAGWKKLTDKVYDNWYYVDESGKLVRNSWKKINDKYYYFYNNGEMAKETVIDGCYLSSSGAWDTSPGWKCSVQYELYTDWYYVDASGKALCSEWKQIGKYHYYFDVWGEMSTEEFVDGYYVDENGVWRQ